MVVETSGQMSLMFHSLSITVPVIAADMRIINCGQLVGMPACSTRDLSVHGEFSAQCLQYDEEGYFENRYWSISCIFDAVTSPLGAQEVSLPFVPSMVVSL